VGTHVFNLSSWASRKPSNLTKKTKTPNPRTPSLTRSHPLHAAAAKLRLASRAAGPPDPHRRTAVVLHLRRGGPPPHLTPVLARLRPVPLLRGCHGGAHPRCSDPSSVAVSRLSLPSLSVSGPSPFRAAAVAAPIADVQILPPQPSASSRPSQ
jgi:hypothetical protein